MKTESSYRQEKGERKKARKKQRKKKRKKEKNRRKKETNSLICGRSPNIHLSRQNEKKRLGYLLHPSQPRC